MRAKVVWDAARHLGVDLVCHVHGRANQADQMRDYFLGDPAAGVTTHTRRVMALGEVANMAAFMASDRASGMTGTTVNLSMGALGD